MSGSLRESSWQRFVERLGSMSPHPAVAGEAALRGGQTNAMSGVGRSGHGPTPRWPWNG